MTPLRVVVPDDDLRARLGEQVDALAERHGVALAVSLSAAAPAGVDRVAFLGAGAHLDAVLAVIRPLTPLRRAPVVAVVATLVPVRWPQPELSFQVASGDNDPVPAALAAIVVLLFAYDEVVKQAPDAAYDGARAIRCLHAAVAENLAAGRCRAGDMSRLVHLLGTLPRPTAAGKAPRASTELTRTLSNLPASLASARPLSPALAQWTEPATRKIDSLAPTVHLQAAALVAAVAREGMALPRALAADASSRGQAAVVAYFVELDNRAQTGRIDLAGARAELLELAGAARQSAPGGGGAPLSRARQLGASWAESESGWLTGALLAPGRVAAGLQSLGAALAAGLLVAVVPLVGWAFLPVGLPLTPLRLGVAVAAGALAAGAVALVHRLARQAHLDAADEIEGGMAVGLEGLQKEIVAGREAAAARLVASAGADAQGRAAALVDVLDRARVGLRELVAIPGAARATHALDAGEALTAQKSPHWQSSGGPPEHTPDRGDGLAAGLDRRLLRAALVTPFDASMLLLDTQRRWIDEGLRALPPAVPPAPPLPAGELPRRKPVDVQGLPPGLLAVASIGWQEAP